MSKFCENCGAEMEDSEIVCKHCGPQAPAEEPVVTDTTVNKGANKNDNTKNIVVIAVVAAVVIALIVLLSSVLGGGYKKPVKNFFKGMEKADAEMYMSAFPEFMDYDYDKDDMEDMLDMLEDEYGKNIKISYKIEEKEKIDKEDLEYVQEYIEEVYEEEVKVTKGYKLEVEATIKGKEDDDTDDQDMYIYKIDGDWCYFSVSPKTAKNYVKD